MRCRCRLPAIPHLAAPHVGREHDDRWRLTSGFNAGVSKPPSCQGCWPRTMAASRTQPDRRITIIHERSGRTDHSPAVHTCGSPIPSRIVRSVASTTPPNTRSAAKRWAARPDSGRHGSGGGAHGLPRGGRQIERGRRIASRLRCRACGRADGLGCGGWSRTADRKALRNGLPVARGDRRDPQSPIKRLASAELSLLGSLFGEAVLRIARGSTGSCRAPNG